MLTICRQGEARRRSWRAASRIALVSSATLILLAPLKANAEPPSYITAAFSACLGHPATIEERLQGLNDAGWIVANDNQLNSEMFGLSIAAGYGFLEVGSWVDQDQFEQTGRIDPVPPSYLRGLREGNRVGVKLGPGQPVNVDGFVDFAQGNGAMAFLNLVSSTSPAVLSLVMYPDSRSANRYSVYCSLFLADPITRSEIDNNIPPGVRQADLRKSEQHTDHTTYYLSYATTSSMRGEVTYEDARELDEVAAFHARHNLTVELSAILRLETPDVRLSDNVSSFRKVTP
jgi:hypothetical protein